MEIRNSPFSNNEDRISKLQDTLIHHILSFLDMKYAVQSSILSRRWKHIWTSLPTLNFNSNLFIPPEQEDYITYSDEKVVGFVEFVDNVFILRNSSSDIQRFRLVCSGCDISKRLSTWVVAAVRGNVEEIFVDTSVSKLFRFPDCLFTCKSLTNLGLKMDLKIILPNSIDLPRLKYLNLASVSFDNEKLINKLFSSCPVLESLIVDGWINHVNLNVCSHKLKHFQLVNHFNGSTVKLHAPNLKSFISSNLDCYLENLASLVTADIKVDENDDEMPEINSELYAQRLMKCLRVLHNVKELTLSTRLLEVVPGALELLDSQPPPFCNLQCLKLRTSLSSDSMHAIAYLLKISPNIESLYLEIITRYGPKPRSCDETISNSGNIGDYWEAGLSSACMLYHLKLVEIRGVRVNRACVNELAFLEILLKNAMALEKVVIFNSSRYPSFKSYWRSSKDQLDRKLMVFRQKLLTFPKASTSIAIFFF